MSITTETLLITGLQNLLNKATLQKRAHVWEQATFCHTDTELARKLETEFQKLVVELKDFNNARRIADGCADMLLLLMLIAERNGFDIIEAAHYKLDTNIGHVDHADQLASEAEETDE